MDPSDLRAAIPALDEVIYLNTGACGPSPRRVVDATETFVEFQAYESPAADGMYVAASEVYEETRRTVADHVGADENEIALTESTTDGINRVACAIDWDPGDVVVRTDLEHAAGILPWRRRRNRGEIDVRVVETERGRIDLDAYAAAVRDARLVCFSALDWLYGARLPTGEMVEIAHDAGAQVLVDAVQLPGQHPVDVSEWGADFVAAAGHKWLLGPWGSGFLYVREDVAETIEPAGIGYRSVVDPYEDPYRYEPGARRFEVGTTSPAPYAGLCAAIETIEAVGLTAIRERIVDLTDRLKEGLPDERLLSPRAPESGLVSFEVDDPEATVERLREEDVRIRSLPSGAVRASIHAFNTPEDVDALLDGL